MDFVVRKTFFSEELKSEYCEGLSYSAKPSDKQLLALIPKWVKEGKVVLGRPVVATVRGGV